MSKKILISLFVLTIGLTSKSQNRSYIDSIKKQFVIINTDTAYQKIELENDEFMDYGTDRGGSLTGYFKNNEIKKIVEWIGISNGYWITEYYYNQMQLIFAYKVFNLFLFNDSSTDFDYNKKPLKTFEARYYFNNKTLIDSTISKDNDSYNPDADDDFFTESDKNVAVLTKKIKNK